MYIIISIHDIWRRYTEQSIALQNVGLEVKDVVHLAFGFAAISASPGPVVGVHQSSGNIFTEVSNLLVDRLPLTNRLPFTRQPAYGVNDTIVYHVVDIIGEISQMLIDAVVNQIGSFPPQLRLLHLTGPDLVLTISEEGRELLRDCQTQSRAF